MFVQLTNCACLPLNVEKSSFAKYQSALAEAAPNLVLIEGMKNASSGLIIEKPLIIHEKNGEYKKEILDMFKEV